ncbi:MAG: hypothetical protein JWM09_518 [Francisellaceae bacterium]|nr:hypothetical protein [Francisellaceae bacterium]
MQFLKMGGYGIYIWPCYILMFFIFGFFALEAYNQRKTILNTL